MSDASDSMYEDDIEQFCTPEIKAMLSYHSGVLLSFSKLAGKTSNDLKEFLLDTCARMYDLCEQLPVHEPKHTKH